MTQDKHESLIPQFNGYRRKPLAEPVLKGASRVGDKHIHAD